MLTSVVSQRERRAKWALVRNLRDWETSKEQASKADCQRRPERTRETSRKPEGRGPRAAQVHRPRARASDSTQPRAVAGASIPWSCHTGATEVLRTVLELKAENPDDPRVRKEGREEKCAQNFDVKNDLRIAEAWVPAPTMNSF